MTTKSVQRYRYFLCTLSQTFDYIELLSIPSTIIEVEQMNLWVFIILSYGLVCEGFQLPRSSRRWHPLFSQRPGEIDADFTYNKPTAPVGAAGDTTTTPTDDDDVFGAEFKVPAGLNDENDATYWRGKTMYKKINPEKRQQVMKGYDNLRITFLFDNLFVSAIGLALVWSLGTYKDAFSYGIGALLGTGYAALLSRYVENLGGGGGGASGGAARFAPVLLLILLYAKNKTYISIIPELLGFFSFQVASLLQIFNEDAYGEDSSRDS